MRWSWKIGRLAGIEVRVHVTFAFLIAWIAWARYAEQGLQQAAVGVGLILLVFGVVVLHELGHALTARRFGIRTRDITLLPVGGVARLERMPENPRHQLLVAIAGPAVNVALAGILAMLALALGQPLVPQDVTGVRDILAQLMWINIALALFNMVPAFPMDGGRVLRAVMALRLDPGRATQMAATLGQGIAIVLGVVGLLANPILLLVAVFIWLGAGTESKMAQLKHAIEGLPVRSAMARSVQTVEPGDDLRLASTLAVQGFQHDFPVVVGRKVVGLLTHGGLLTGLSQSGPSGKVRDFMQTQLCFAHPSEVLDHAFGRLEAAPVQAMPVTLDDGTLVGLLTPQSVAELVALRGALDARVASRRASGMAVASSPPF